MIKQIQTQREYGLKNKALQKNMFHNILANHTPIHLPSEKFSEPFVQYTVGFGH